MDPNSLMNDTAPADGAQEFEVTNPEVNQTAEWYLSDEYLNAASTDDNGGESGEGQSNDDQDQSATSSADEPGGDQTVVDGEQTGTQFKSQEEAEKAYANLRSKYNSEQNETKARLEAQEKLLAQIVSDKEAKGDEALEPYRVHAEVIASLELGTEQGYLAAFDKAYKARAIDPNMVDQVIAAVGAQNPVLAAKMTRDSVMREIRDEQEKTAKEQEQSQTMTAQSQEAAKAAYEAVAQQVPDFVEHAENIKALADDFTDVLGNFLTNTGEMEFEAQAQQQMDLMYMLYLASVGSQALQGGQKTQEEQTQEVKEAIAQRQQTPPVEGVGRAGGGPEPEQPQNIEEIVRRDFGLG